MSEQTTQLPQELAAQLPQHAQQIYSAAFKAAQEDGMSESGAKEVGLSSVRNQYAQDKDGKWYNKGEITNQHYKSVYSGGN